MTTTVTSSEWNFLEAAEVLSEVRAMEVEGAVDSVEAAVEATPQEGHNIESKSQV